MRRTFTGRAGADGRLSSGGAGGLERLEAGLDEAGYGPLLGPLCLGYAAFGGGEPTADLWKALEAAVAPRPGPSALPAVCDSKVLHRGPEKFARLERTALLFTTLARGARPRTIREFVDGPLGPGREVFDRHPWYRDLDVPLPRRVPASVLGEDLDRAAGALDRTGIVVRDAGVRVVPESELNDGIRRTGNKAAVHFAFAASVVRRLATLPRSGEARIVVDRLGGRRFYARALEGALPEFHPEAVDEGTRRSTVRLHGPAGRALLQFAVGGEQIAFACALGSILAKYARELLVERLNRHFLERAPGLRPTAGYRTDGRRFLRDLELVLGASARDEAVVRLR